MFRILVLSCLLVPCLAEAANLHNPSESYSDLLQLVRDNANLWSERLRGFAMRIFASLATIQLVLTVGPLVARRAAQGEILYEIAWYLVKTIFFFSLLHYSVVWGQAIVDSFRQAGAHAAGVGPGFRPGDMFDLAVSLGDTVSSVSTLNPAEGIGIMVSALAILLSFTFIAAFMGLTLIESYVVINAAVLFMGFGGAEATREYAMAMVRYAIAVGAKLFVLTLIVGIVMTSAQSWQASYTHDNASTLTLVGLALMCAIFSKTIPDLVQSLITGISPGGGSLIGGMAAAGMALGAAAAATISTKLATSNIMSGEGGMGGGIANAISSSLSGGGSYGKSAGAAPSGPLGSAPPPSSSRSYATTSAPQFGGNPPGPSGGVTKKAAQAAHTATAATARTVGTIAEIAVPGMDGASNLSIGPSPASFDPGVPQGGSEQVEDTPENVIRPATPETTKPSIDTSSGISDALNNRGNK